MSLAMRPTGFSMAQIGGRKSRALRDCSGLTSVVAASIRRVGPVAQLALATSCDAGWGRVGACRARWLTSISSLSAAGFQEMRPARAPA